MLRPTLALYLVVFRDAGQRIHKYIASLASSDSVDTPEHYYDAQGLLRFIFVKVGP